MLCIGPVFLGWRDSQLRFHSLPPFGLSTGRYHLVTALPNGNADEEPLRHGKWSGGRVPVETSVDNNDGDLRQTGVT